MVKEVILLITIFEGVDGGTSVALVVVEQYYLQLIYYQQHL
jgi:hypothetical protein